MVRFPPPPKSHDTFCPPISRFPMVDASQFSLCASPLCASKHPEDVVLRSSSKEDAVSWLSKFIIERGDPCEPDAASDAACVYALACYWAMVLVA